jgi:hypothetical protein
MITRRPDYEPTAYDDDWESLPIAGPFAKYVGGLIAPLALATYGIATILQQHAIVGSQITLELTGPNAVAIGIAAISIAGFLHCHYFWGNIDWLSFWATLGKILSLISFIASVGYLLIEVGIFGRK